MASCESASKKTRMSSSPESAEGDLQKTLDERRKWEFTEFGLQHLKKPVDGFDFTVMTYNILSQQNLELNSNLYSHCQPDILEWTYRGPNLLAEIEKHSTDVICLQEIEETPFHCFFKPRLDSLGYDGLFKKKSGDHLDGCAIFFKKNRLELQCHVAVEFHHSEVRVLDRDNIGLVAIFKPKVNDDSRIVIATTHLLYNPRRGDVKLSQLRVLLAEIDRLSFKDYVEAQRPLYHPIILCGDMNSEPFSPLYNFVTCGSIFYKNLKAGSVSGQSKGKNKGRLLTTDNLTLSPLGIGRDSKYKATERLRQMKLLGNESESQNLFDNTSCAAVSDKNAVCSGGTVTVHKTENSCDKNDASSSERETGTKSGLEFFNHHLNFLSAYKHYKLDGSEETTIHNSDTCCTVDYIFHNVYKKFSFVLDGKQNHKSIVEGQLRLIGNYGLLTEKDLIDIDGLPNSLLSSDHVCLISRFLLTSPVLRKY